VTVEFFQERQWVGLLETDPDLAHGLGARDTGLVRQCAVARVLELEVPGWDPEMLERATAEGWLGLYVIEGLMIRSVNVGKRAACELFGPGDLFRPWDADGEYDPLPISVTWKVLAPTRLAELDHEFVHRIAPWPMITSHIVSRVARRARYLALTQAVTHLPRATSRLLILFWLLAERWGRVGVDGVRITLPLTHELLSMLIGAHRPTVTIALQRLRRAGLLERRGSDLWVLTRLAIDRLGEPESLAEIDAGADGGNDEPLS